MLLSEERGYDSVWLTEHHFIDYGISTIPLALASAIAACTQRIRIALAAAIHPFHDPIRLSEEIAFADILSKRRLSVGTGRGNRPIEFRGWRIAQKENRERFEESVEIMVQAWTQERTSHHGKFFHIDNIPVIPKPYPPLLLVCVSPDTIVVAARRAWPMLNSILFGPLDQVVRNRDMYIFAMQENGCSEADIKTALASWGVSRHVYVYVASTDSRAIREAKSAEPWHQDSLARFLVPDNIDAAPRPLQPQFRMIAERFKTVTWEDLHKETVLFGSPERIIDKVGEMEAAGVGELLCWTNFGGLPQDRVERSMRLFAEKVMPHFRG